MERLICTQGFSPLRKEARHQAEMVSQLIFGEVFEVLEAGPNEWIRVRSALDGYEGWCQRPQEETIPAGKPEDNSYLLNPYWSGRLYWGKSRLRIPFGSILHLNKDHQLDWNKEIVFRGKAWDPLQTGRSKAEITRLAMKFLNTPYLWGGKTVFGTDCSGFTQTLFRFLNIPLLRDAWQQAGQGEPVERFSQARCGDLAFFSEPGGRITHVGLLLAQDRIIHASGKVRMDLLTENGIIQEESGRQTHALAAIRRYF